MFEHRFKDLHHTYRAIREVESEHHNIANIIKYVHKNNRVRQPSVGSHIRLRKKWEVEKSTLHARLSWDLERMQVWQLEHLSKLVDFAYNYVPFYHALYHEAGFRTGDIVTWSDFEKLPIVDKKMLVDNRSALCASIGFAPDNHHVARTSGSSGINFTIVQDDTSVDTRVVLNLRQTEMMVGHALSPDDWRYGIYLASERFTSLAGGYPVITVGQDCPAVDVFEHIQKIKPKILYAFPSYLKRLQVCAGDLTEWGVECICTNSEPSTQEERQVFARHFGVPVLDEYSSEEFSLIATECKYGRYHIVEDNLKAEVCNIDPEGWGTLVGTSFANTYMPFIRYSQGDIVKLDARQILCECGTHFRYLDTFHGRADQFLESKNNGKIPPDKLMGLYDSTLILETSGVKEFQIVQTHLDKIEIRIVLMDKEGAYNYALMSNFVSGIKQLFSGDPLTVSVHVLESIPAAKSYKRRLIVNMINS